MLEIQKRKPSDLLPGSTRAGCEFEGVFCLAAELVCAHMSVRKLDAATWSGVCCQCNLYTLLCETHWCFATHITVCAFTHVCCRRQMPAADSARCSGQFRPVHCLANVHPVEHSQCSLPTLWQCFTDNVSLSHCQCAQALRDLLTGVWDQLQGSLAPAVRDFSTASAGATLAYEEIAAPGSPQSDSTTDTCVLVHGLLGSGRNWRSFARRLIGDALNASGRHEASPNYFCCCCWPHLPVCALICFLRHI